MSEKSEPSNHLDELILENSSIPIPSNPKFENNKPYKELEEDGVEDEDKESEPEHKESEEDKDEYERKELDKSDELSTIDKNTPQMHLSEILNYKIIKLTDEFDQKEEFYQQRISNLEKKYAYFLEEESKHNQLIDQLQLVRQKERVQSNNQKKEFRFDFLKMETNNKLLIQKLEFIENENKLIIKENKILKDQVAEDRRKMECKLLETNQEIKKQMEIKSNENKLFSKEKQYSAETERKKQKKIKQMVIIHNNHKFIF